MALVRTLSQYILRKGSHVHFSPTVSGVQHDLHTAYKHAAAIQGCRDPVCHSSSRFEGFPKPCDRRAMPRRVLLRAF